MMQGFAHAVTGETVREPVLEFGNGNQLSQRIARVQHFSLFSGISAAARKEIVSAAREKLYSRRQILFMQDDPMERVILLVSGAVKTTQNGRNGNEVILRMSGPGELIGANGLVCVRHHQATAQVMSSSRALIWNAADFGALSVRFPMLRTNASGMLGEHLSDLEERFCEMSTQSAPLRVGHEIARLANRIGQRVNDAVKIQLSREDLAQLTGTTLFTVSRLLSQWKKLGIVTVGREFVMVHDAQGLAELSESN